MTANFEKLIKSMPQGIDAILITSPENRWYYTGFRSSAGVVVVTKKESYFIIDSRYYESASSQVKGIKVLLEEKRTDQIKMILRKHKITKLAIESRTVTISELSHLQQKLAGIELLTDDQVSDLMETQRAIKSKEEIAMIRAAQSIADKAFLHILNFIQTDRTEREIAVEIEIFCRREGSDAPSFPTIVASGCNSSKPHWQASDKTIATGDFVTIDFGCTVGGYCSDMTRTVILGSVTPVQQELYETVLAAQLAALAAVKSGVCCKQVDKIARDIIEASEFRGMFGHGLGHGVGMQVHESPRCSPLSPTASKLLEGMVTSVEPGIYMPGQYGVRIEDVVAVTQNGCENLCVSPKELIIL